MTANGVLKGQTGIILIRSEVTQTYQDENDQRKLFRGYTNMTTVEVSGFVVQRLHRHDNNESFMICCSEVAQT